MITNVYSVHDIKTKIFMPPATFINHDDAKRQIRSQLLSRKNQISDYPKDYRLYCIGRFDDSFGVINPYDIPELVIEIDDLLGDKDDTA